MKNIAILIMWLALLPPMSGSHCDVMVPTTLPPGLTDHMTSLPLQTDQMLSAVITRPCC